MYDVAIIGAGPAGSSAALFTAKAGKSTLVIDSDHSMTKRAWFDNFYGIEAISGPDLLAVGQKQAEKFGAKYVTGKAENIVKQGEGFRIELENEQFEAKHVILATGVMTDLAEKIGLTTKPATEPRIKTIVETDASGKTNIDGIWVAGTIAGMSVHGIITAGDGAKVAVNVISELTGDRYVDHDVLKQS
jgi:thioredoxin reductase (NADPH)